MVSKVYEGTLIHWGKTLWTVRENKTQQIEIQHHSTEFKKTISLPFRIHWTGQPGENHISLERATILHLRCFYWCNISVSHTCNYLNFMSLRYSNPLTSFHRWKNWEMVQGSGLGAGWVSRSTAPVLSTAALRAAASLLQERFVCSLSSHQISAGQHRPCSSAAAINNWGFSEPLFREERNQQGGEEWLGMLPVTLWRTQSRKENVSGFTQLFSPLPWHPVSLKTTFPFESSSVHLFHPTKSQLQLGPWSS